MGVWADCDECDRPCNGLLCSTCAKHDAVKSLESWVTREKTIGNLKPDVLVEFERMLEDLR